jgi:Protein of unknown function (DUF3224)
MPLIARFQVDGYEPRQVTGLDGDWFGLMTFAKTFTSGIIGRATTLFMAAGSEEGSRSYVATERITGHTEGGTEGSVTVQHGGSSRTRPPGSAASCPAPAPGASPAGRARPGSCTTTRARTSRSNWPERAVDRVARRSCHR